MPRRAAASAKTEPRAYRFAAAWHAAWALAILAVAAMLTLTDRLEPGPELFALGEGAAAAALGALLSLAGRAGRTIAVLVWTIAAAAACQMTGGLAGPLAAWCLAPLAAACAFREPRRIALGAAASIGAVGVAAVGAAFLPGPTVSPELALWLSLLAVATTTVGLASAALVLLGGARAELRRLDERELELLEALDQQPQLLATLDSGGRVLAAFGPPLMGCLARELPGRAFAELAADADRSSLEDALRRAADHGSAELAIAPAADPDGWLELTVRRLPGARLALAARDARGQRAREDQLRRARLSAEEQNAGKSRFLANMSHELRTPLNAIMGFSDIMRQRLFGPMGDRYAEYAELIHESGSHLLELINDVLDMSKIEADRYELHRELFDAREAVQAVLRLMRGQAERAGVQLRVVLPVEPLAADADRRAVKQIALNLVSNALKFTPRGGSVTITAQGAGDVFELIVADSGVGIARADLERLGAPFQQAGDAHQRAAGSGLGLSLVRAFARLHGGEMILESAVGEGTTVTVRMPVLVPKPEAAPAREANG